ncbi:hypothetical protein HJG60_009275 [Phyllostomus discolor]|uniref:Uncharacterized protein n=1 Tax=Phyllostomus discolor TaxID=89673 RepID=A0A833YQ93_9CHIR|nr:hypothetical protein HJG60_009275 [Phyllostomus discolor]
MGKQSEWGQGMLPESARPPPGLTCTWAHITAPLVPTYTLSCFLHLHMPRVYDCSQHTKAIHTHAHLYILTLSYMLPHSYTHLDLHTCKFIRSLSHSHTLMHESPGRPGGRQEPRFLQPPHGVGPQCPRALTGSSVQGRHRMTLNFRGLAPVRNPPWLPGPEASVWSAPSAFAGSPLPSCPASSPPPTPKCRPLSGSPSGPVRTAARGQAAPSARSTIPTFPSRILPPHHLLQELPRLHPQIVAPFFKDFIYF